MRKTLQVLLIALFIVAFTSLGFSQRLTGSLTGTVIDEESSPLPGVTITLSSPALLGDRDFVTVDTGNFRFPALPPGTYEMVCELPGFKTMRRVGIIISVGKTTTISVVLEQSPVEEEVTVTAVSPVLDVKSTKVSVSMTKDLIDNIPLGRDIYDLMLSAPGAVTENSPTLRTFSSYGSSVAGNRFALDGVDMTDPAVRVAMTNFNFDIIDEVEMELGAHPADVGSLMGGAYINVVTRSGGNDFHGQANVYYFTESFVDENFTDEQLDAFGVSGPSMEKGLKDFSLSVGGPVIKDKFWFFLSGRYFDSATVVSGFPIDVTHKERFIFGKLTFQIADNIKLTGMFNNVNVHEPHRNIAIGPYQTPDSAMDWEEPTTAVNGHINWILNQNAFLDVRASYSVRNIYFLLQDGSTHRNYDRGTGITSGAWRYPETNKRGRYQIKPDLTLFLDDFLGGDHELKIGGEYESDYFDRDAWHDDPVQTYSWNGAPYYFGGNVGLFVPFALTNQEGAQWAQNRIKGYAAYIQDNWTIKDRVTLNIGLRFSRQSATLPAQNAAEIPTWTFLDPVFFGSKEYPEVKDLLTFSNLSPRLGLTFDVFGNGKTLFKVNAARYYEYMIGTYFLNANPNNVSYQQYLWIDNNLDAQFDPGDTYSLLASRGRSQFDPRDLFTPDIKTPAWEELIIGIDHELIPDFRLGVSYIYKHQKNLFENIERDAEENWGAQFTVTDPGYDEVAGTADDSQLTVFDRTKPFEGLISTNPRDAYRKYQGFEVVFEKRMSNNWQLFGSILYSKSYGTTEGYLGNSQGQSGAYNTPNWYINRAGRTGFDRPLVIKLQGSYLLPYGINLSAFFFATSGSPFQRVLNVYAPMFRNYVAVNAEPQGSRRNVSTSRMDLRIEKEFRFGNFSRLGFFVDVFNAFNSGYININNSLHGFIEANGSFRKNPQWQRVTGVTFPRRIKVGVRFTF